LVGGVLQDIARNALRIYRWELMDDEVLIVPPVEPFFEKWF
jgi:hypothetical protein